MVIMIKKENQRKPKLVRSIYTYRRRVKMNKSVTRLKKMRLIIKKQVRNHL